jgi:hypothetical protein
MIAKILVAVMLLGWAGMATGQSAVGVEGAIVISTAYCDRTIVVGKSSKTVKELFPDECPAKIEDDAVLPGFVKDLNDHRICASASSGHWQRELLDNTCPDPPCKNVADDSVDGREFWRKQGWHCRMAGATWFVEKTKPQVNP